MQKISLLEGSACVKDGISQQIHELEERLLFQKEKCQRDILAYKDQTESAQLLSKKKEIELSNYVEANTMLVFKVCNSIKKFIVQNVDEELIPKICSSSDLEPNQLLEDLVASLFDLYNLLHIELQKCKIRLEDRARKEGIAS